MIDAWRKSSSSENSTGFLIPFSPPIEEWTDEHYTLFGLVEVIVGNRKEIAPDEQKDIAFAEEVDDMIESGDPNWLQKVEEYMEGGYSLDEIPLEDMYEDIEKEQKARGQ